VLIRVKHDLTGSSDSCSTVLEVAASAVHKEDRYNSCSEAEQSNDAVGRQ
jgi:hypothetical protein